MTLCIGTDITKNAKPQTHIFQPKSTRGSHHSPAWPIVSANGCPTETISTVVHFLNPLSTLNKSYVKDTTHILKIINDTGAVPRHSNLVTPSVTLLYTNICIPTGIQVAHRSLGKFRSQSSFKPTDKSLIQLLEPRINSSSIINTIYKSYDVLWAPG